LYDFWIEIVPQSNGSLPSDAEQDPGGPTVLEALHEQLGLKLEPTTARWMSSSSITLRSLRRIECGVRQ
jgi:uncharacterized protein (TIGR03435 family)